MDYLGTWETRASTSAYFRTASSISCTVTVSPGTMTSRSRPNTLVWTCSALHPFAHAHAHNGAATLQGSIPDKGSDGGGGRAHTHACGRIDRAHGVAAMQGLRTASKVS